MSKRASMISSRSPRVAQTESFNPYDSVKRQSEIEKQRRETMQKYNSPTIIINDDPIIPNYPIQESFKKHSNYSMKIVVVGDGGCGKTCLLVSYAQSKFPEVYVPTVFENYVTCVSTPNEKAIELALWDTAGQEEYDRLRPLSYPDTDLLLVCFSLDNITSLQNVKDTWYPEISHFCPGVPVILVGTKADLNTVIDPDLPIQVATEINAVGYIQCSAKTMFNIRTVFNFALDHFQKSMDYQESLERSSKNRLSKVFGHSRNVSGSSQRKGHLKNASYDSAVLMDRPLTEDTSDTNPYSYYNSTYNEDEFSFTRKDRNKKKRRCTIL